MRTATEILYIGFLLGHGGDAVQMLELATGMAQRGRTVRLIVPELETTVGFAEECRRRGLPVVRTPWVRSDARHSNQDFGNLVRLFMRYRASILHLHTGDVCLPRSVPQVMRLLSVPRSFVTIHSPRETLEPSRARAWAKMAPRVFHQVICPSHHSRRMQVSLGLPEETVTTIHNCIDVERFRHGDPDIPRGTLGLAPDTPLVVFTSRLDEQKRPMDALEAFHQVVAANPSAHLAFVGQGNLEKPLRAAVVAKGLSDRVHFAGLQKNIPDWLAAATAWILPTEAENFSLSVLEALAAGCPILSTLCRGNNEVLLPERNALIAPIGDVEAFARQLKRLLGDAALRDRLSAEARRTSKGYSLERMIDAYIRCYSLSNSSYDTLTTSAARTRLVTD
ncbi:MAG: glycosyltransferase family 4 protein [Capsulimonadales bacterium]|nr:glycosyltransferase family 4 protein [Capsulimonadales bacterium]